MAQIIEYYVFRAKLAERQAKANREAANASLTREFAADSVVCSLPSRHGRSKRRRASRKWTAR
jgi:hypothetical protein